MTRYGSVGDSLDHVTGRGWDRWGGTNVWVVIPAARQHLDHVEACLDALGNFGNHVVVVTNGHDPIQQRELPVHVVHDKQPDVNISRWWNLGLEWIAAADSSPHHVLIMNADARILTEGVARLSLALDEHPDACMAGPMRGRSVHHETRHGFLGFEQRIPGFCFMLASRSGLRADEQFQWWAGDDDLEWRARRQGGTLLVGPIEYAHLSDGTPRGHLRDLAVADLRRFEAKWGVRPW
jgi:hypothetical protein